MQSSEGSFELRKGEVTSLGALVIGSFIVLIGPLSYFFGADSRLTSKSGRDWWPARPRR
jgi:hypothetical protein